MDHVKIAFICLILFSLSLGLVILLLTMSGSSACNGCEALPMWIGLNNSLIEINFSEEKNYILVPTTSFSKYFDFYLKRGEIFWAEENSKSTQIYRSWLRNSPTDNTSWQVPIVVAGLLGAKPQMVASLGTCGGLAVDWLHSHLYWADVESGSLQVATLDGSHRRVIYSNKSTVITTIAVDPIWKLIFWLEKNQSQNKPGFFFLYIKSSNLRGSEIKTVVSNVSGPALYLERNLALDTAKRKLYYLQKPGVLTRCDYDGLNIVQINSDLPTPASIGVSTNQVYWMDKFGDVFTKVKNEDEVHKILSVCKNCRKEKKQELFNINIQIKIVDKHFQESSEVKTALNEDCLYNTTSFTEVCPCPLGYRTLERSNSCREEGILFISYNSIIQGVTVEGKKMTTYFKRNTIIPDFDFHFVKNILFWFDSNDGKIYRAPLSNPSNNYMVALLVRNTAGLAVDWIYDNLYWTNNNKLGGCVEVCRLDGSMRQQLIPRDRANYFISIAVDPFQGLMYISNWTDGSIERAGMDGVSSHSLVPGGLEQPRSLTLEFTTQYNSYEARQIFWLESYEEEATVIKSCYLQNRVNCREVYSRRGNRPSALTLLHNRLYWLDSQYIHHIRVDNHGRLKKIQVSDKHQESFSLRAYHSSTQPPGQNYCPWNSCQPTELCLPSSMEFSQLNTRCVARNKP